MIPSKVVFLDRDGVINHDSSDYIKSWEEFRFIPGSLDALALLSQAGCRVMVVTNQSVINRGMVPPDTLRRTHRRMQAAVAAAGGCIEAIFFCPHRPDENCACRKPAPGMLLQARNRYGLDLAQAVMIGDSAKDILCGINAGCGATILVRTGNGPAAEAQLAALHIRPDAVVDDLLAAARLLLVTNRVPGNG